MRLPRRGSLIIAVALSASLWTACGGSGPDAARTAPSTSAETSTTAPSGPPAGAQLVPMRDLKPDVCFDVLSDSKSLSRAAWRIDCAAPHDYEIFASFDYQGDKAKPVPGFPGVPAVQDEAERRCYAQFEAFVGVRWSVSELDIRTWWPTEESWAHNDRRILCAVTSVNKRSLSGTQRGSNR